ncbi:MAG: HlyC/CorC family transporter [Phycisphaerales bacterium]|nr:HlyC/CorC family transporter [Phycisphaerales bacterium]
MDWTIWAIFIAAVLTALCVSALCSLLEATLLSLTPAQIATIGAKRPAVASIWQGFKANIERPIAVILILNTAAHTIGATIAGAEAERLFGERWVFVFSIGLTYVMLQFTEILPKTLGVTYNRSLAIIIARPLAMVVRVLTPVLRFVHFVNRPFEGRTAPGGVRAMEEIASLASAARVGGRIRADQARLVKAASRLPDLRVRQIMTPRSDVAYLRVDDPLPEVLRRVQSTPYTRLPLVEGDLDRVIGTIHVRDLFNRLEVGPSEAGAATMTMTLPADLDLRTLMRRALVVPESAPVPHLLAQFRASRIHMAVVVDEYGVTMGVASLENVIEEMVGEIEDEFDHAAPEIVRDGDHYRVDGTTPLHTLRDRFGPTFTDADVDTIGGLLTKRLGRLPGVGDTVRLGDFDATVLTVERRRVGAIALTTPGPETTTPAT